MRVLEFFSGIGGFATAIGRLADAVLAFDIRQAAVDTYRLNFERHRCELRAIESIPHARISTFAADLWWVSPPCQPFTHQGRQRDLNDARTQPLIALIDQIPQSQPTYFAMENVPGFAQSETRVCLLRALEQQHYQVCEFDVCPSQLGWPMRRRRYYLVGSRAQDLMAPRSVTGRNWRELWDRRPTARDSIAFAEDRLLESFCKHLHFVRFDAADAVARCFTSAYGRSPLRSGSYILEQDGRIRHFAPCEMLRLMGFPDSFQVPSSLTARTAWSLIGNSLAIPAVRHILSTIPRLAALPSVGEQEFA